MRSLTILRTAVAAAGLGIAGGAVAAQEYTFTLHHFLGATAPAHTRMLEPWAERVAEASDGRVQIEIYPSMTLGGRPPELINQARDGVVDIVWTVNGYTPGRFPHTEVFELPFMVTEAGAASSALWQMYEQHMADTIFQDVHMLAMWVHGSGVFHTSRPVTAPGDLQGMKIRGGSRAVNDLLGLTGAEAIGMPVTAVAESLSRGVIDGTTIPWEVTSAVRVAELVDNHTEFEGASLYTLTFSFAMNRDAYDALPPDLKAVIDRNSGHDFSVFAGQTQEAADDPARQFAVERGNTIITISADAATEWAAVVEPIYASWVADMERQGIDGQALLDQARALMAGYDD